jgi:hypothetical protein
MRKSNSKPGTGRESAVPFSVSGRVDVKLSVVITSRGLEELLEAAMTATVLRLETNLDWLKLSAKRKMELVNIVSMVCATKILTLVENVWYGLI